MTVSDISIPIKYVFVQATEPTDKTEGKLWYNTSSGILYSSDGNNYVALETDLTDLERQQLQQNINILVNSASASSTLNDYDDMFLDIFSDDDGYSNTVDTGNTTALFKTDKYQNTGAGSDVSDANSLTYTISNDVTPKHGYKIYAKDTYRIKSITKVAECTATHAYLQSEDGLTTHATATFSGNVATFTTNYVITSGVSYRVVVDSDGASFVNRRTEGAIGFPINCTNINYTLAYGYGEGDSIISVETSSYSYSDKIVQTNAQTITANPTGHQIYCKNTLGGSATITYNISFDGGSTWVEDQPLNTKNTSVHNGSSMIIKLNLNGTNFPNTVEADNYAVMLYY